MSKLRLLLIAAYILLCLSACQPTTLHPENSATPSLLAHIVTKKIKMIKGNT